MDLALAKAQPWYKHNSQGAPLCDSLDESKYGGY